MTTRPAKLNVQRLILGGLAAGLLINAVEYVVHGVLLDPQWTAAFAALGRTPKGWATFIPANFEVGLVGIWVYTKFLPSYVPGRKAALRAALSIWIVFWIFWVIPTMAMQPMDLFPNVLLFSTIAVGLLDSIRPFCLARGSMGRDLTAVCPARPGINHFGKRSAELPAMCMSRQGP